MVQEAGEVSGPPGGAHLGVHAGADAGDLVEADLVDLVGSEVGGGVAARLEGVEFATAAARADADLGRGGGQVFVGGEVDPGLTARDDLFGDDGGGAGAQDLLIGGRDGRGEGGERAQQRVGRGREGGLVAEDGQRAFDDGFRLDEAGLEPAPGVGQAFVVPCVEEAQPRQPGVGVGAAGDPGAGGEEARALSRPALGVEGEAAAVEADGLDRPVDAVGEEVPVQGVVGRQGRGVDGGEAAPEFVQRFEAGDLGGAGLVRQSGLGRLVPFTRGLDRVEAELPGVVVGDDGGEGGVFCGRRRRGRRRLGVGSHGRTGQKQARDCGDDEAIHERSPNEGGMGTEEGGEVNGRRA